MRAPRPAATETRPRPAPRRDRGGMGWPSWPSNHRVFRKIAPKGAKNHREGPFFLGQPGFFVQISEAYQKPMLAALVLVANRSPMYWSLPLSLMLAALVSVANRSTAAAVPPKAAMLAALVLVANRSAVRRLAARRSRQPSPPVTSWNDNVAHKTRNL